MMCRHCITRSSLASQFLKFKSADSFVEYLAKSLASNPFFDDWETDFNIVVVTPHRSVSSTQLADKVFLHKVRPDRLFEFSKGRQILYCIIEKGCNIEDQFVLEDIWNRIGIDFDNYKGSFAIHPGVYWE